MDLIKFAELYNYNLNKKREYCLLNLQNYSQKGLAAGRILKQNSTEVKKASPSAPKRDRLRFQMINLGLYRRGGF